MYSKKYVAAAGNDAMCLVEYCQLFTWEIGMSSWTKTLKCLQGESEVTKSNKDGGRFEGCN